MPAQSVVISNVTLTLDQLLAAIRQLDKPARIRVAKTLVATEMDTKLSALIARLAEREPADDIADEVIKDEVDMPLRSREGYALHRTLP